MKPRRESRELLPPSPLRLAYPLLVRGPEIEGAVVLAELPRTVSATVLRLLRLVLAFARAAHGAPPPREALARWEAELQPRPDHPLWASAITIVAEVQAGDRANRRMLAQACMVVCEWLIEKEAWQSALHFAQAAALAWPENPAVAWAAGRMLRNHGKMREAEYWLLRAQRIAVWNGDRQTEDLALNSLGNLYALQGCYDRALETLSRALKVASRTSAERRGCVSHDLMLVYTALGEFSRAEEMANAALRLYGSSHPKLPRLAFDMALLWCEQGKFRPALPVLQELLGIHATMPERLLVLGALARSAGASGEHAMFDHAWKEIWATIGDPLPSAASVIPMVLAELGAGAASLRDWTRAADALRIALHRAEETGQYDVIARVDAGLACVAAH